MAGNILEIPLLRDPQKEIFGAVSNLLQTVLIQYPGIGPEMAKGVSVEIRTPTGTILCVQAVAEPREKHIIR